MTALAQLPGSEVVRRTHAKHERLLPAPCSFAAPRLTGPKQEFDRIMRRGQPKNNALACRRQLRHGRVQCPKPTVTVGLPRKKDAEWVLGRSRRVPLPDLTAACSWMRKKSYVIPPTFPYDPTVPSFAAWNVDRAAPTRTCDLKAMRWPHRIDRMRLSGP